MREIRFRAWSKEIKKMFQKCSINWNGEVTFAWNPQEKDNNKVKDMAGTKYEEDCIPMQFTGLLDKNGKEIYERDVLLGRFILDKVEDHIFLSLTEEEKRTQSKIFVVDDIFYPYTNQIPEDLEVIGNIYENPELLSKLTTK